MAASDATQPAEIAKLQEIARTNVAAAKSMREAVLRSMASPSPATVFSEDAHRRG